MPFQFTCEQCGVMYWRKERRPSRYCSYACNSRSRTGTRRIPPPNRFWSKVDRPSGPDACWIWQGSKTKDGYGRFSLNRSVWLAHRVSWEFENGPIPDGLHVCHNCPDGDNPACVNPAHLWLGTSADNMRDMARKGRSAVLRGAESVNAKLTTDQVLEMRTKYAAGGVSQAEIGVEYGISRGYVHQILRGQTWRAGPFPQPDDAEEVERLSGGPVAMKHGEAA